MQNLEIKLKMAEKPQPLDLGRLAVEVAKLSAEQDEDGSWWGFDTDISDLPIEIKAVIRRYLKSACEFYLKYKDKPLLLVKDWNEKWGDVFDFIDRFSYWTKRNKKVWKLNKYNEWLFKLAFKPVLEENENERE